MSELAETPDPLLQLRGWMADMGKAERTAGGIVYVIQCENLPFVKIGFTNYGTIKRRLHTLQTASPFDLRVLLEIGGDVALERELHDRFRRYKIRGEWYHLKGAVAAFIESKRGPA